MSTTRKIIVSGARPTGRLHLGNYHGAIKNWLRLQHEHECLFFVADWHALTTDWSESRDVGRNTIEMVLDWLAIGLDPSRCTIFQQSAVKEHAELFLLLAMLTPVPWLERNPTYKEQRDAMEGRDLSTLGFLAYPVLQAADVLVYKATAVPVGIDQAPHIELAREITRRFNGLYGPIFPEPTAVFTDAPIVLGTDGVKKMSKSVGNTIDILGDPELIRKQVMSMVTDTKRILRTDPGRPEVCNVCQLHRFFGDDYEDIWDGERTARTGCVDTKKLLAQRIVDHYAPARERYAELMADPRQIDGILEQGADRLKPKAQATMDEVRHKMGLR